MSPVKVCKKLNVVTFRRSKPDFPRDKFYVKILEDEARLCYKGMAYRGYLLPPVDFLSGVQTRDFFTKNFTVLQQLSLLEG